MRFPNHGWWSTGDPWPETITMEQFAEFFSKIAPTPEDRAQIAEHLGVEPWGYASRSDLWDCVRAWIFRRELGHESPEVAEFLEELRDRVDRLKRPAASANP